jgi:hypothetical protein
LGIKEGRGDAASKSAFACEMEHYGRKEIKIYWVQNFLE